MGRSASFLSPGQLYLNDQLNEYLIVSKVDRGVIGYRGIGFMGNLEDEKFQKRFKPVDPADVDSAELEQLLKLCPPGTSAKVGAFFD